ESAINVRGSSYSPVILARNSGSQGVGIEGISTGPAPQGYLPPIGVYGSSSNGDGIAGDTDGAGRGVSGNNLGSGPGVEGDSNGGYGVEGKGYAAGVFGY